MSIVDKVGSFLDSCRNNPRAEMAGYLAILAGLILSLGPWSLLSVAGLWWINEVVDG